MRKLRIGNKLVLTLATTAIAGASVGVCLFASKNTNNPLLYKQEVNAGKEKTQSINFFPHNYHSLDFEYQKLYWPDITRENIHDPVPSGSSFVAYHIYDNDITYDRFINLFYPSNTVVSIYGGKDATEGEKYSGSGDFKEQSVLTNWTSQNGFAYISSLDVAFDTQAERDDYKEKHPQDYDKALKEYNKANSFLNVFGGNRDVAQYFFSGIKNSANDGKGIDEEEQVDGHVINIETAKLTRYSIQQFVNWLISTSTTTGSINLDLSQLYLTDLDRDNSVLALLNPQLWEYLLLSCIDDNYQTKISKIDLSYNNLRIVPNLASIRNKDDTNWFWEDVDGTLGTGGMNKVCEGSEIVLGEPQMDGYFDGIDLSNNNLTYFDFSAYNPWDGTDWGDQYGKSQQIRDQSKGNGRVPSLVSLVKCRYETYTDVYDFDIIADPSKLKPKSENLIGVNIDYNRLPWIMMNPLVEPDNQTYVWWRPMLHSWIGLKPGEIAEWFGIDLPDYILTCARAYLTYTVANYRSDAIDGILSVLEYIFGFGTYQIDGINWTDKEIYNYINCSDDSYGRNLMRQKKSSQINIAEAREILNRYVINFINAGQLMSLPLNKTLIDADVIRISPKIKDYHFTSDGVSGIFEVPIMYDLARIKYLPDSFEIKDDSSLNDLATKIFDTVGLNYVSFLTVPGFVKDYGTVIGVSVGLSVFVLAIIVIAIIRLIINIRHQYEYRSEELNAELKSKKKKKGK